jgi:hypothetical protein
MAIVAGDLRVALMGKAQRLDGDAFDAVPFALSSASEAAREEQHAEQKAQNVWASRQWN